MRPMLKTIAPIDTDRNGISVAQSKAGAGYLTITGALASGGVATFSTPAHVSVYAAGNNSGVTFTITGTDRRGLALTEDITGPNATTAKGTKNFATITSVYVSAATTGDVEVGSADQLESAWFPVDYNVSGYNINVEESSTANMNYTTQHTFVNPFTQSFDESVANPQDGSPGGPVRAVRVKITDFVAGSLIFNLVQIP